MPAGRPTKYTPELLIKAHEYLEKWQELGDATPQLVGLAIHCDISDETLFEWIKHKDKKEFSDIVTRVSQFRHKALVNNGLVGTYNPQVTKLLLSQFGYSEKKEIDINDITPVINIQNLNE